MILALRISSMLALVLAACLLVATVLRWCGDDPKIARIRSVPTALEKLEEGRREPAGSAHKTPPLVAAAEVFATYLIPPARPEQPPASAPAARPAPPAVPVERLKVYATSYYPDRPERSLALISGRGSSPMDRRWMKQGSSCGSCVIHEIRRGAVVYREGDRWHEATVEHGVHPPTTGGRWPPSSRRVSAAIADALRNLSASTDPNHIEVNGN